MTGDRWAPRSALSAGRMAARRVQNPGEESPGSTETRCRVTPGGGDPRESATENIPPSVLTAARVKWCGKSAPRRRQRTRHGKPHREQDQIGTARALQGPGGFRAAVRVGRARRPATCVPDEWPSPRRQPGRDRTRLTGRLALYLIDVPAGIFCLTLGLFVPILFVAMG